MWDSLLLALSETAKIILMVTTLMLIIEFSELKFQDKIHKKLTENPLNQIVFASLLGAIPGCFDAFFVVSLYTHGLVGFGALTAVMLSTAGDEAFIMLSLIPETALLIFATSIIFGLIGGFLAEKIAKFMNLKTSKPCEIEIHEEDVTLKHFLKDHVYTHILKKHVPRLFLWIFSAIFILDLLMENFDFAPFVSGLPKLTLIFFAALIGILPESGPHTFFVFLFSRGLIPFSVLLVNTLSQDGHGILPLLSYSIKDSAYVQVFTTLFALGVGIMLFLFGV
ncbi:MAG: putative manganese transporter [Candidatus Jordarchaeaceae archaeon]